MDGRNTTSTPQPPNTGNPPIRVLVVDDHGVVRRGMHSYLETMDDIDCIGEAADGKRRSTRWPPWTLLGTCLTS